MNRRWMGTATGCVLAAVAGFLLARPPAAEMAIAKSAADNGRAAVGENGRFGREFPAGSVGKTRTAEQLAALKLDLCGRFRDSPSAGHDWALRTQAAAILSTMSPGELEAFAKELSPKGTSMDGDSWKFALKCEIARQWGLKDPAGACLDPTGSGWISDGAVFNDWLKRDPAAAEAWVTAGNFPTGSEKVGEKLQGDFLNHLVLTDFAAARESLGKLNPDTQQKTLLSWSGLVSNDPGKRVEFLALLATRDDAALSEKCYHGLVREMAAKSPSEAAAFVEATDLPEAQKDQLSHQVLAQWAENDPHQAFAAWAALKEDTAPPTLLQAMDSWSVNSPGAEEAVEWVKKLDAGPAREQIKAHLIESMSSGERYAQAADLGNTLADPKERIRQLKTVKRDWEQRFPKQAGEWFAKLPETDRQVIEAKLE